LKHIKDEVNHIKNLIGTKIHKASNEQVEAKFMEWVTLGSLASGDTKIFKLKKLYWLHKSFISQVVEERGQPLQEILFKLTMLE
jgi:hypothetical protein